MIECGYYRLSSGKSIVTHKNKVPACTAEVGHLYPKEQVINSVAIPKPKSTASITQPQRIFFIGFPPLEVTIRLATKRVFSG
jgi:hypothetical protein